MNKMILNIKGSCFRFLPLICTGDENYKESLDEDFKLTDIEKFKNFFDEMGIEYKEWKYDQINEIVLEIDKKHVYTGYSSELNINFNLDTGEFVEFEPWGE